MHGQEVGRELLAFLYRHTEGNPLFIAQLLRTLVEEGALWQAMAVGSGLRCPSCGYQSDSRRLFPDVWGNFHRAPRPC